MEDNHLNNLIQQRFRKGRSCHSQLLVHTERLLSFIENDENVDVIYLDFSKAFDRVDHKILLYKIKKIRINGNILKWIESFLTHQTHIYHRKKKSYQEFYKGQYLARSFS